MKQMEYMLTSIQGEKIRMKTYQEFIQDVEEDNNHSMLDEAGNFSAGNALKKHNDVIRFGKQVLKSADATDAESA